MKKVTKAVIPAAGLGTRVLPATKAMPKGMLPLVDKPAIQYLVEEAVRSGITDILIILGRTDDGAGDERTLEVHAAQNARVQNTEHANQTQKQCGNKHGSIPPSYLLTIRCDRWVLP